MAEDAETDENEVSFISALDDAELRFNCFLACKDCSDVHSFSDALGMAKQLYAWIMDDDNEEAADPLSETPTEECTRKH